MMSVQTEPQIAKLKFGTDGWRAIIGEDFTVENVARVTLGVVSWLKTNFENPSVVVGHDCRFAGALFVDTVVKVLGSHGIKCFKADGFITTPMISLGALKLEASLGVVITASHNPPSYNGYKLKGHFGGPLLPKEIQEVEDLIPRCNDIVLKDVSVAALEEKGLVEMVDLETMYLDHVEANFDMKLIRESGLNLAYDAMYGSGQAVMRRLLPEISFLHCEENPSFEGISPEPIHRNLQEFSEMIRLSDGGIDCGLATDGDADRIGLYDSKGNFVDSHHIILLLIKYLVEDKNYTGKVVNAFSVTPKVKKMCAHFGLDYQVVQIGFKNIAGIILAEDVLLGGEESGGIAIKGHIPERDGIWMGLALWEYMAKTGKTLEELTQGVYDIVGAFKFERIDLHLEEADKHRIMDICAADGYSSFDGMEVRRIEKVDGFKFFFDNDEWVMIRPSGTEPVLRTYAEAATTERAFEILACTHKEIQKK